MVRRDRCQAAAADRGDASALGFDAAPRLGVVGRRDELLLAGANLHRERTLPRLGQQLSGSKRCPISPASPSRSSPQAASTTASSPRSPRLRRRVSMLPRSGSIESSGSSASSCARRRTEAVPIRIPGRSAVGAAERVARVLPREVRADGEAGRVRRGHVLRRMDRGVDPPLEQRLLELLDEHAALADLARTGCGGRGRRRS